MSVQTISPKGLSEIIRSGKKVDLIDVRTPIEYREVHVDIAKSLPLDQLSLEKVASLRTDATQPLYIICKSGGRGKQGCEKLIAQGQSNVINVEGGTTAWEQAGLPVIRGKKAMSLERQVRIAAGSLAFTGSVLGYFVHPYFIGLSAFVGAGLVFAGLTDTCAMGLMLAKMPWNQVRTA